MIARLRRSRLLQRHPTPIFWALYVALHGLLFLPLFLLADDSNTLLPHSMLQGGWWPAFNRLLIWRANFDPFRLSIELALLVGLWACVRRWQRGWLRVLTVGFYLFALLYYTYEAAMASIWQLDANFYRELFLARDGLPFLLGHLQAGWWMYLGAALGLAAAVALVVLLVNALLESAASPAFGRTARVLAGALAVGCVLAAALYRPWTAEREMVLSSLAFKLRSNIAASQQMAQDIGTFDDSMARIAYAYPGATLTRRPDIYLIFVESYGSVLYHRPHFTPTYLRLLDESQDALEAAGWGTVSALSESPVWGGGSWMAYTSTLFGIRIDNHPQYLSLFERYQVGDYPGLGRTLQKQGYTYAWVSSISEELNDGVWEQYQRFTGVDRQFRYRDLDYWGPEYGWGPAPPDQYVLHYADDALQAGTDQPLFFVTITQNSHFPWSGQPPLLENWRDFGTMESADAVAQNALPRIDVPAATWEELTTRRRDYLTAIDYQIRMLTDFVLSHNDDAIFILLGDHQPPQVSGPQDGWATPVHIIARDPALLRAFEPYGFTAGLRVADGSPRLHHEGLYSLLMRVLLEQYGNGATALPAYLPEGALTHAQTAALIPQE